VEELQAFEDMVGDFWATRLFTPDVLKLWAALPVVQIECPPRGDVNGPPMTPEELKKLARQFRYEPWDTIDRWRTSFERLQEKIFELTCPPEDAFDGDDLKILNALLKRDPRALIEQDIAVNAGLSRPTVGRRLQELRRRGLVTRPRGKKKANVLTPLGLKVLAGYRLKGNPPRSS
jgi:hypothetical protein